MTKPELSVILPCRNEAAALDQCLTAIKEVCRNANIRAEIIVADSSNDASPHIARRHGVKLVAHGQVGYGRALQAGFAAAEGRFLLCADADLSYNFADIPQFVSSLRQGADFVIGIRQYQLGSSPWLHQYVGVPLTAAIIRLFFGGKIRDPHCGLRAITQSAYQHLKVTAPGMEFASEMVITALQHNLRITQLPTQYLPRVGQSKLRTWRDGWRHLTLVLRLKAAR